MLQHDLGRDERYIQLLRKYNALTLQVAIMADEKKELVNKLRIQEKDASQESYKHANDEEFMNKALQIVEDNINSKEFNSNMFVQEMGMSKTRIHNRLKSLTGLSISAFNRSVRLEKAVDLLNTGENSIAEIAYTVGFNDPRYFTKCFKKKYGKSPSDYINN